MKERPLPLPSTIPECTVEYPGVLGGILTRAEALLVSIRSHEDVAERMPMSESRSVM